MFERKRGQRVHTWWRPRAQLDNATVLPRPFALAIPGVALLPCSRLPLRPICIALPFPSPAVLQAKPLPSP